MSKYILSRFDCLEEYTPGEQPQDKKYVKLNTNESPFPPAKAVLDALSREESEKLRLYSDPQGSELKKALANTYGLKAENVFVCNGSDEALNFFFAAYSQDTVPMYCPEISYGFYPVFAQLYHTPYYAVPMEEDFSIDYKKFCAVDGNVCIANPNAPTGIALTTKQIEEILASNPNHMVCIDEAYVDFGGVSCLPLLEKYSNLLVCRTYSKSRSLAGARLGFAFGSADVIADLEKIKYSTNPYNVNRLTQIAGIASLTDPDYFSACCAEIAQNRDYLTAELTKIGFTMTPSVANFIFAKHKEARGEHLYLKLKENGVLVRHFKNPKITDYLRITIGTREECDILISKLKEIL